MTLMTVLLAATIPVTVTVDWGQSVGPVKPVNGVGQPPMVNMPMSSPLFHYFGEAGIPYSRLHDVGGAYGQMRYVDIPNIFKDFDADENDPKSYDFSFTDILLKKLVEQGVEPYYRLGVTIENHWEFGIKAGSNERIRPPKDFAKWARICEHVIRHYTEGWNNGFRFKINYWEIWNEPDNGETPERNPLWQAAFSEYIRFYGVVASHLKAKFPHLKIGGYGSCGYYYASEEKPAAGAHASARSVYFVNCTKDFLAAVKENGWPLDFFSFHSYSAPEDAFVQISFADKLLTSYGFPASRTERSLNEWLPAPSHQALGTTKQAAMVAAELIGLQNGPCATACLYDGRCGVGDYSPLFNPLTYRPHKAYWSLVAFNQLRQRRNAVKAMCDGEGFYAAAARNGEDGAVMIVNNTATARPLALKLGSAKATAAYIIDEDRDFVPCSVPEELPPHSIAVVIAK